MSSSPPASSSWTIPATPGYPQAIQNAGTVVAPLLAGFSATLMGLLLDGDVARETRWPDLALLCLVVAAISFIMAVQAAVSARTNAVTPDEMRSWYVGLAEPQLHERQREYVDAHDRWADATIVAFRVGILAFLAGVAVILVPSGDVTPLRGAVVAVGAAGLLGEAAWIGANALKRRRDPRYHYRRNRGGGSAGGAARRTRWSQRDSNP